MKRTTCNMLGLLGLGFVVATMFGLEATACTSFMLENDNGRYFVHSLNFGRATSVPGAIFINQRDTWKEGYSWAALAQVNEEASPSLAWKSKYGSVTFNTFGLDVPDGGMNEAGLYIWEMGFDTEYPSEATKPMLFQCQWMQYVLDNFSATEEVIENADRMAIDGWGWHYFVADKTGKTAIIDFVDGKPLVYSGDNMPVPLCCNSSYSDGMRWLRQHKGFGGDLEIEQIFEEIPRFVYGAKLLQEFSTQDPVDYGFHLLDEVSENVRWSVVFDVNNMTAYWNTNINKEVRHFAVSPEDFGREDGPLVLDVECPGPEDVKGQFVPYSDETNAEYLSAGFGTVCELSPAFKKMLLDDQGIELDTFVRSFNEKIRSSNNTTAFSLQGDWVGSYTVGSEEEPMELPAALHLGGPENHLVGTAFYDEEVGDLPISNLTYNGGLLYFTVKNPDGGDISHWQLYALPNEIRGSIDIWTSGKSATLRLVRDGSVGR